MVPRTAEGRALGSRRGGGVARRPAAVPLMVPFLVCLLNVAAARPSAILQVGTAASYQFEAHGATTVRRLLQSDANQKLWDAASKGNAVGVKEALKEGADVEFRSGPTDTTPLLEACSSGHVDSAIALIEAGAEINARDNDGGSALILAVQTGELAIVEALLKAGASTDPLTPRDGASLLFRVTTDGDKKVVRRLIDAGEDVDTSSGPTRTPLMVAASSGDAPIVAALLDAGVRPDERDEFNNTALHYAPLGEGPDSENVTRALLLKGVRVYERGNKGRTPLLIAAELGNVGVVKVLLEVEADPSVEDDEGETAESLVCTCARTSEMFPGCSGDGCNKGNAKELIMSLLEEALHGGNSTEKLWKAAEDGNATAAREALEQGANVTLPWGLYEDTPLWPACLGGHTEVVEVLIEAGADVNAVDIYGAPPLIPAIAGGKVEIVEALLAAGATTEGRGPGRYVDVQIPTSSLDSSAGNASNLTALPTGAAHAVIGVWAVVETPLILTAAYSDIRLMEALLAGGARPDEQDSFNDTALHWAPLRVKPGSENVTRALLEAGVPVDVRGNRGRTALHNAAEFGNMGVVRILLEAGADPSLENDNGDKAEDIVCLCTRSKVPSLCPNVCSEGDARTEIEQFLSTGNVDTPATG